jgi:N-acetylglucosamine kinase-like BadF-type ATPase
MNYDEINVDEVVENVASAVEKGNYRKATKKETMSVRLAALSAIVRKMQSIIENDKELAGV